MKRAGNLFDRITAFPNILSAARRAQKCKRFRQEVLAFNYDIEANVLAIQRQLRAREYLPGPFKTFVICEPKRRFISAAPYRDRVVHHALCNIVEPVFDATFLESSYANRVGKGTHRALDHFVRNARKYAYCLRADVEKFFPSIDHALLKETFRRKIKCPGALWLMDLVLDHSNEQEPCEIYLPGDDLLAPVERRHGLPIGNLTSQLWANLFLNGVDHAIAGQFGGARYVRYVDDIAVFSDDAGELADAQFRLGELLTRIRLRLHPVKTQVTALRHGVNFLGFRIFPDHVRLRQENLRRARRRLKALARDYRDGAIDFHALHNSVRSWVAHAAYGDTWRLREHVFDSLVFSRN